MKLAFKSSNFVLEKESAANKIFQMGLVFLDKRFHLFNKTNKRANKIESLATSVIWVGIVLSRAPPARSHRGRPGSWRASHLERGTEMEKNQQQNFPSTSSSCFIWSLTLARTLALDWERGRRNWNLLEEWDQKEGKREEDCRDEEGSIAEKWRARPSSMNEAGERSLHYLKFLGFFCLFQEKFKF